MSSTTKIPNMKDMTVENITANTILINSQGKDRRMKFVLERMVQHLHDFARETRLSTEEWMAGLNFLVEVGQISTDVRHEFILLSDILGLSLLVDSINHPKPQDCTEGTVLGPFHTHEAETLSSGSLISHDSTGTPLLVLCSLTDKSGAAIPDVKIDIWETDASGHYDVQHVERDGPDGRAVLRSEKDGTFWFKAITPVSYPIPHDGPVGKLLGHLERHPWRPAHMHFMFEKTGWDHLVTALYIPPDPYMTSDAVFGVKESLIVPLQTVNSEQAAKYGVEEGTHLLQHNFVLVTSQETSALRDKNAMESMAILFPGKKVELVEHLPVPELD